MDLQGIIQRLCFNIINELNDKRLELAVYYVNNLSDLPRQLHREMILKFKRARKASFIVIPILFFFAPLIATSEGYAGFVFSLSSLYFIYYQCQEACN